MEIKQARVLRIDPIEERAHDGKTYRTQRVTLIMNENNQYPDVAEFEIRQGKIEELMKGVSTGAVLSDISFNFSGREYEKDGKKRTFNSLSVWKWTAPTATTTPDASPLF